jgi:hypothetical protein
MAYECLERDSGVNLLNRPELSTSLTLTNTIQHVPITKVSLLQSDMHTNSKTCPRRPPSTRLLSPFTRMSRARALRCGKTAQNRAHHANNRNQEISAAAGMRVQLQVQHDSDAVEVQQTCQRSRRPFSEYWDVYCEGVQRA